MEREDRRNLQILNEIAEGGSLTQRGLAEKLGIALGLVNLYLKRLARKGHIKVTTIPPNRIKYLLTPKGFAQKTRLTYEYMDYSLKLFRRTRRILRDALLPLTSQAERRCAIYGTDEAAELTFLTLRELGLGVTCVLDQTGDGATFLDMPVRPLSTLEPDSLDVVIVASFVPDKGAVSALIERGMPSEKIICLWEA